VGWSIRVYSVTGLNRALQYLFCSVSTILLQDYSSQDSSRFKRYYTLMQQIVIQINIVSVRYDASVLNSESRALVWECKVFGSSPSLRAPDQFPDFVPPSSHNIPLYHGSSQQDSDFSGDSPDSITAWLCIYFTGTEVSTGRWGGSRAGFGVMLVWSLCWTVVLFMPAMVGLPGTARFSWTSVSYITKLATADTFPSPFSSSAAAPPVLQLLLL